MAQRHENAAAAFMAKHHYSGVPVDVEKLAAKEGIRVVKQPLDASVSGLLLRAEDSVVLGVNEAHAQQRQRFTIAHEIGHYLMHPGRQYTVDSSVRVNWRNDLSSLATDREEIDANAFAAALLMPMREVRVLAAEIASQGHDQDSVIAELATAFLVSREAMGYRLINLGIST